MAYKWETGIENWSREKLLRKFDQESEMMCLALNDGDKQDAETHHNQMELCREYLRLSH